MKEINSYLPYFPLAATIGTVRFVPTSFPDNELKDIMDGNLPQGIK